MADETQWNDCLDRVVEAIALLNLEGLSEPDGGGTHKRRQTIRGEKLDLLPLVVVSPEGKVEYQRRDSEDGVWRGYPVQVSICRAANRAASEGMETGAEWAVKIEKAVVAIRRTILPGLRGDAVVEEPSTEFRKDAQAAGYDLVNLRFRFWMRGTET